MSAPPVVASPARFISAADLHDDVLTLRRTFESLHPGLRRYNTPAQLDSAFSTLEAHLAHGASSREAFRAFSEFAAKVRCGHTFLNPTNQSSAVQHEIFDGPHLPLHFRWIDSGMIVTENLATDVQIPPGTEVLAIGEVAARDVLARLKTVARADGSNDRKRVAELERRGMDRFEPFDIAFPLFFPTPERFVLDLREPDGAVHRVTVSGTLPTPQESAPPPSASAALWSLRYLDDHTAFLPMRTWVTYDTDWDWKRDIERIFGDLESHHATTLIVDLRGNEGGSDVGDRILAHYIDRPLPEGNLQRWTRYRSVPEDLRPNLHTWDRSFFDWGDAARPRGGGFYRLTKYDDAESGDVLQPLDPRARAKLIVLVDGANSSATFQFADLVQRHRLGVLIGEPTGGNRRGINGGAFFFLSLPRRGLENDLPLIGRFPADGRTDAFPDEGLTPDIVVYPTPMDIAHGRDAALDAALRRARGG